MIIKQAYLAGPIQHVSEDQATSWRDEVATVLKGFGIDVLDPMRNQHLKRFPDGTWDKKAIVELDLQDLHEADILLAYCPQPSAGTSMEIMYMKNTLHKPVLVVCDNDTLSPWVEYFADECFKSFEDLIDYLNIKLTTKWAAKES